MSTQIATEGWYVVAPPKGAGADVYRSAYCPGGEVVHAAGGEPYLCPGGEREATARCNRGISADVTGVPGLRAEKRPLPPALIQAQMAELRAEQEYLAATIEWEDNGRRGPAPVPPPSRRTTDSHGIVGRFAREAADKCRPEDAAGGFAIGDGKTMHEADLPPVFLGPPGV